MKTPQPRRPRRETANRQATTPRRGNSLSAGSPSELCSGVLELHPRGYGFLRRVTRNLARRDDDVFVPESLVQTYRLQAGVSVTGMSQRVCRTAGPRLVRIEDVNDIDPKSYADVSIFEDLTPTNPTTWLRLERENGPASMRVLDLLCPVGIGQRALIASPPRAGKTTLLRQIGHSIAANYPDIQLVALLIDERPEEVTDIRTEIDGEVFASSLDEDVTNHARLAHLVLNRCQRMAETGKDVVLLVDSLTRLSRACNKLPNLTGAIGAGGLNIRALDMPRQLFAAARAFKEQGSLTIIATVLIETENRMDEVIFREFKGTGNLDIVLSQQLADRRIWPALDISQSATRRVELLHDPSTLQATTVLRNSLLSLPPIDAMSELTRRLESSKSNKEFISMINRAMSSSC